MLAQRCVDQPGQLTAQLRWDDTDGDPVRCEDMALGVSKKIVVRDGRLAGVILVGDASDSHRYMEWLRTDADLTTQRRHLLFPQHRSPSDIGRTSRLGEHDPAAGLAVAS